VNLVVGTAGHVDHGKSSLVLALTGTDPDRLAEEKRRGMTIELGFAAWTLPGGDRVGVVDVPGHRRFIRTMLAGAHGIDCVLLVVAADEGVMPQTREHLAICELLGARRGVVALTKADLVDEDMLALAREDVQQVIDASALRGAPIVACSSVTGDGLDELSRAVESVLRRAESRPDLDRPRLWIDRAFALAGFGTVMTGTLEGGSLHAGEEVAVLPTGLRARIRGLQHHGDDVATAEPGRRTAVNLGGVSHHDVGRGMALVRPGCLVAAARLDVFLQVLGDAPAPVRHRSEVVLFCGTAEVPAEVWLLEGSELQPGQAGFAQLDLRTPVPAAHHDRFVVRRASPPATLGGGRVLDTTPRRHRRRDPAVAASLSRRQEDGIETVLLEELRKLRLGADLAMLVPAAAAGRGLVERALRGLGDAVRPLGQRWLAHERWEELRQRSATALSAYHDAEPLRAGMPREEWRSCLRLPAALAADVAHGLGSEGRLVESGGVVALPGRGRLVSEQTRSAADAVVALLEERGLDPPTAAELRSAGLGPQLLRHLVDERRVVRLSADVLLAASVYESARARIEAHLAEHGEATVAQLRDALGATRRVVVPLLEALDAARVTVRSGDLRRLRRSAT